MVTILRKAKVERFEEAILKEYTEAKATHKKLIKKKNKEIRERDLEALA